MANRTVSTYTDLGFAYTQVEYNVADPATPTYRRLNPDGTMDRQGWKIATDHGPRHHRLDGPDFMLANGHMTWTLYDSSYWAVEIQGNHWHP